MPKRDSPVPAAWAWSLVWIWTVLWTAILLPQCTTPQEDEKPKRLVPTADVPPGPASAAEILAPTIDLDDVRQAVFMLSKEFRACTQDAPEYFIPDTRYVLRLSLSQQGAVEVKSIAQRPEDAEFDPKAPLPACFVRVAKRWKLPNLDRAADLEVPFAPGWSADRKRLTITLGDIVDHNEPPPPPPPTKAKAKSKEKGSSE